MSVGKSNADMLRVELPAEEWVKMEQNHELMENFKINKELDGSEEAFNILMKEIKELEDEGEI